MGDGKAALCQGAGLIEYDGFGLSQRFHIAGALYQDAAAGSPADTAEEGERYADNQRAGAGNDQEYQGTLHPGAPGLGEEQGRNDRQQGGACHDAGGVPVGKPGDEAFHPGLLVGGVFHQFQDLGGGGFAVGALGLNRNDTGEIYRTADHRIALRLILRQAFAGQGGGIHSGRALQDHAIQRDLFAGADDDGLPYFHFIGVHLFFLSIPHHIGVIGAEIHKLGDVAAGLSHGNALEPFTDLIEQHNGDGFPVIAQYKGADGGNRHEEFLVHQVTVQDLADSTPQDIPADNEIRHTVGQKLPDALQRENEPHQCQQYRRGDNAGQMLFLFSCHFGNPLSPVMAENIT